MRLLRSLWSLAMTDTNFMFDELDKNIPIPPAAPGSGARPPAPTRAEDIFSDVDKSVKPEVLRPRDQNSLPASTSTVIPSDDSWLKNKGWLAGLVLGGLVIIIGGGYLGLKLMVKDQAPANTQINQETNKNQIVPEVTEPVLEEVEDVVEQPIQPTVTQPVDSDLDGLTDEEEIRFGTSSNSPDTDGANP